MIYIVLFSFLFFLGDPVKVELGNKFNHKIKLERVLKIVDDDFYKHLVVKVNQIGSVLIFNEGNGSLQVYDKAGIKKLTFGRFGEGPGEFSSFPFHMQFAFDKTYIYAYRSFRIMIFDTHNGSLINEFNVENLPLPTFHISKNGLSLSSQKSLKTNHLTVNYSIKGDLISTLENDVSNELTVEELLNSGSLVAIENGFCKYEKGVYKLELLDYKQNITSIYTRDMPRVLKDEKEMQKKRDFIKSLKSKSMKAYVAKNVLDTDSKYLSDIKSVMGTFSSYLFVEITSPNPKISLIDVIDLKKQNLYTQIKFSGDKIRTASIQHKKLLLSRENDEDGIYTEIYNLHFNN